MTPTPTAASGQPTLGRYKLVREIARSNDIVWEGFDPKMNRRVAVKELALGQHLTGQARRDRIERFYREARAAGAMNHPNIVTIHEVGEENGRYFIAMEFLEGQTLRDRMSVGGPMGLSEAVSVTSALCDALEYAHLRGVVHRDIKPDNIYMLSGSRVKLTDFGIARIQHEDQLTVAGQVFGTPSYMSPEQVLGKSIDARSDIFSLGIMLYEMVTGRKPFSGDTVATITYRIVNDTTPPITSGSPALESVIQRATAKDPAMRFQSAAEMKAALLAAEAAHRTGGYRAAAYPSTPMSPVPTAPPTPPAPYSQPQPAYPNATAQYGAQTQFGIAPGYAGQQPPGPQQPYTNPAAVPYPPEMYQPQRQGSGRFAAILGTVAVVLVCFTLLVFGIQKAMQNAAVDQARTTERKKLADAQARYSSGMYEQSANEALKIRNTTNNDQTREDATKTEVYSYLALGQAARIQGDFATAQKWYGLAQQLLPDDPNVKDHLAKFQQAKRYRAAQSIDNPGAGSAGVMPGYNPGPEPVAVPTVTPIPPPRMNTQQFNQSNQSAASQAQSLYEEGLQLQAQGNVNAARAKWQAAVTIGPGSSAANAANAALTKTAPDF